MIHKDAELLTRRGWSRIRTGEFACIRDGKVVWSPVRVSGRYRGAFCHVYGRFFGVCVDAYHPVPAIRYTSHVHGITDISFIEAGHLSPDWVLVNNFDTKSLPRENPYLPYINSFTKSVNHPPGVGERKGGAFYCDDDIQFRLIPDVVKFNRFNDVLKWHGRDYVEDLNGREMRGCCEFANYSALTMDTFELAALGDNRRCERLSPRRLRVYERWNLRVDKMLRFHDYGYSLDSEEALILVRYQGKVGIVGID